MIPLLLALPFAQGPLKNADLEHTEVSAEEEAHFMAKASNGTHSQEP